MNDLAQQAAAKIGIPPEMAERSARARAKADGTTPEAVLARWAGVEAGAAPAPPPAPAAAPAGPEAAPPAAPAAPAEPALEVEVLAGPEEAPAAVEEQPEEQAAEEEEEEPVETLVAAAGIREQQRSGFPRWLQVAFLAVPLLAVWYAVAYATGPKCGNAGALAIDPITGNAVNCDGTEYGSLGGNPVVLGGRLYAVAAQPACATCHGAGGAGGSGPALTGGSLLATFPTCADHQEWIALGTNAWRTARGDTYGATDTPVGGGGIMPGFGEGLTPEEIRAVAVFERVQFGGQDTAEALEDCTVAEEAAAP